MMKCTRLFPLAALVGLTLTMASSVRAADLAPTLSGWFDVSGSSARYYDDFGVVADNQNYFVGGLGGWEFRNFFVFDLTGVNSMITDACLELYNPCLTKDDDDGYYGDSTETFQLTSTSTAAGQLGSVYAPFSASGQAIFNTLGTGTGFGSLVASAADNGQTMELDFNGAGLAYLNAHLGQKVVFSGRLTTLGGDYDQFLFAYTNPTGGSPYLPSTPQVSLNMSLAPALTPEVPAGMQAVPVLLAVGGMGLVKRRRAMLGK
ncbi:MAG: hypothetical protein QM758_06360 [Armatimonas sp.]